MGNSHDKNEVIMDCLVIKRGKSFVLFILLLLNIIKITLGLLTHCTCIYMYIYVFMFSSK